MRWKCGKELVDLPFGEMVFTAGGKVLDQSDGGQIARIAPGIGLANTNESLLVESVCNELMDLLTSFGDMFVGTAGHSFDENVDGSRIVFFLGQKVSREFQRFALRHIVCCRHPHLC